MNKEFEEHIIDGDCGETMSLMVPMVLYNIDVDQIKAQALILDEADASHCRSPFNA